VTKKISFTSRNCTSYR